MHRANLTGWGRSKRWEYWCVTTPTHVLAFTVSSIDYLALHSIWFQEFGGIEYERNATVPLGRGVEFPEGAGIGSVRADTRRLSIELLEEPAGTRLRARADGFEADVLARRPPGHESLGVVIPWSTRRFQYTVKDNTRPCEGTVRIGAREFAFAPGKAWGCLDRGRGRWPYRIVWNWGSASGCLSDGRKLGLQLGGKWTDGTGMTENALCIDGRLHKIGEALTWRYDTHDWGRPWRIRAPSGRVDLSFAPFHQRHGRVEAGVIGTDVHQCFGFWRGTVKDDGGESHHVDGLLGWAEEARMRW